MTLTELMKKASKAYPEDMVMGYWVDSTVERLLMLKKHIIDIIVILLVLIGLLAAVLGCATRPVPCREWMVVSKDFLCE